MTGWPDRRVMVTGGGGFLGRSVVRRLEAAGVREIFVPRSRDYDLRTADGVRAAIGMGRPEIVIHLAAVVGGIGANRENPGRFFYENAIMGIELMEQARLAGVEKFVQIGTVCSYPKFTPVPFREDDLWNGYPEETNAPYGLAKKMLLVQGQAYRQQYGFNVIYLIPVNLYGPGDNFDPASLPRHPGAHQEVRRRAGGRRRSHRGLGHGRGLARVPVRRRRGRGHRARAERYDGADPVNLGVGARSRSASSSTLIVRLTGFEGEIRWDHQAGWPATASAGHEPGARAVRLRGGALRARAKPGWLAPPGPPPHAPGSAAGVGVGAVGAGIRVVLEARMRDGLSGGIQQWVIGLASALSKLEDGPEEYLFLVDEGHDAWLTPYLGGSCRLLIQPAQAPGAPGGSGLAGGIAHGGRAMAARLPLLRRLKHRLVSGERAAWLSPLHRTITEAGADVMHFTRQTAFATTVPSIYQPWDLQHIHLPEFFSPADRERRETAYRAFSAQASLIVVATKWIKADVAKQFGIPHNGSPWSTQRRSPTPTALRRRRKSTTLRRGLGSRADTSSTPPRPGGTRTTNDCSRHFASFETAG